METNDVKRKNAINIINGWSEQKKANQVAYFRTKGYSCNNEEEIITAYLGVYGNAGNAFLGLIGIGILIFIIYTLLAL